VYFQCSACRYQCSLVSGTVFESSKLALPKWFLAMHLITQAKNSVSALELMRHLGVSYPTAWLVKHKLMEVMQLREQDRRLTGRVQIDDAYLGGELSGGKRGRGSPNKVEFIAAVQTTESLIRSPFAAQPIDRSDAASPDRTIPLWRRSDAEIDVEHWHATDPRVPPWAPRFCARAAASTLCSNP
jgi:hypothetical protein